MELKQHFVMLGYEKTDSLNRTFMELKRIIIENGEVKSGSLNRTFMELKQAKLPIAGLSVVVLIAPLWN